MSESANVALTQPTTETVASEPCCAEGCCPPACCAPEDEGPCC